MTVTAEKDGRNLVLTMAGVDEPFVVRPLPGLAGVQITDAYLRAAGGMSAADMEAAFIMAIDGARENAITGRWEPPPTDERPNYTRVSRELSQAEAEEILMPAYLWQTTLGIDGVNAYLEGGGGLPGTLKATGALSRRLGLLARPTSPKASETA